jgi:hypothetical protein
MVNNFERFQRDIASLSMWGTALTLAMQKELNPDLKIKPELSYEFKKVFPFSSSYESWYSEALALVPQLIPDRKDDFRAYYPPKNNRKDIANANYTISDYLRGISVSRASEEIVSRSAALKPMLQQSNIVKGMQGRLKSSLFEIKALVQADLLDDELHAAQELNSKGFQRGAGAIAGGVLEAHLGEICTRRTIVLKKKEPSISDLNDALKAESVIEVAAWRFIQHLGDLRNKCDHKKSSDPTKEEITELINGVRKITKTVF